MATSVGRRLALLALAATLVSAAGCSVVEQKSADTTRGLAARVGHPMRYRMAGADPALRANLDRALDELAAGNHRAALPLLNRALWDVARIRKRDLRLAETVSVYESLERAYAAMDGATLITFMILVMRLLPPLKQLSQTPTTAQQSLAAAERLFDVLDQPTEVAPPMRRRLAPGLPGRDPLLSGLHLLRDAGARPRPGRAAAAGRLRSGLRRLRTGRAARGPGAHRRAEAAEQSLT